MGTPLASDGKLLIPMDIPEVYVDGLGRIVTLDGGNARYYLYADKPQDDGTVRREAVLCIVAPMTALPNAVEQMLAVMGRKVSDTLGNLMRGLN